MQYYSSQYYSGLLPHLCLGFGIGAFGPLPLSPPTVATMTTRNRLNSSSNSRSSRVSTPKKPGSWPIPLSSRSHYRGYSTTSSNTPDTWTAGSPIKTMFMMGASEEDHLRCKDGVGEEGHPSDVVAEMIRTSNVSVNELIVIFTRQLSTDSLSSSEVQIAQNGSKDSGGGEDEVCLPQLQ